MEASTTEKNPLVLCDTIRFVINGEAHHIVVEPQWTLQYVLADKLGLTGTKEFCAEGACGACTVIMDGRPVLSCMMLAIECADRHIETIEGIARANHPLIEAYVKYSCMQCGFCTPGFVVTAKALLDRNPDPTLDEIKEAMVGNLCRCGTYPAHLKAISEAAAVLRGVVETDEGARTTLSVPTNAAIRARAAGMAAGGTVDSDLVGGPEGGGGRE